MDNYINIALPKGRLGDKVYGIFESLGYGCPAIREENRRLIFEDEKNQVRYFWAKPSDVAIYVERGAADVGVAGRDILLEYEPDVYELLDLGIGRCRMAVAGMKGQRPSTRRTLKVATKFPHIAHDFYAARSQDIDIVKLNGSIEIAPVLGMTDVIVDIVETGKTLRENGLEVYEEIFPISARFVANKASYKFKTAQIDEMRRRLAEALEENK